MDFKKPCGSCFENPSSCFRTPQMVIIWYSRQNWLTSIPWRAHAHRCLQKFWPSRDHSTQYNARADKQLIIYPKGSFNVIMITAIIIL